MSEPLGWFTCSGQWRIPAARHSAASFHVMGSSEVCRRAESITATAMPVGPFRPREGACVYAPVRGEGKQGQCSLLDKNNHSGENKIAQYRLQLQQQMMS